MQLAASPRSDWLASPGQLDNRTRKDARRSLSRIARASRVARCWRCANPCGSREMPGHWTRRPFLEQQGPGYNQFVAQQEEGQYRQPVAARNLPRPGGGRDWRDSPNSCADHQATSKLAGLHASDSSGQWPGMRKGVGRAASVFDYRPSNGRSTDTSLPYWWAAPEPGDLSTGAPVRGMLRDTLCARVTEQQVADQYTAACKPVLRR